MRLSIDLKPGRKYLICEDDANYVYVFLRKYMEIYPENPGLILTTKNPEDAVKLYEQYSLDKNRVFIICIEAPLRKDPEHLWRRFPFDQVGKKFGFSEESYAKTGFLKKDFYLVQSYPEAVRSVLQTFISDISNESCVVVDGYFDKSAKSDIEDGYVKFINGMIAFDNSNRHLKKRLEETVVLGQVNASTFIEKYKNLAMEHNRITVVCTIDEDITMNDNVITALQKLSKARRRTIDKQRAITLVLKDLYTYFKDKQMPDEANACGNAINVIQTLKRARKSDTDLTTPSK
ncbi:MAG: hypothetical protein ABIF92_01055 [archaeon]